MGLKEAQDKIVANMKSWQKIENASVASTGRIIEKTENPVVRLIMEIIQRDSQMHHRVQGLIADSLESKALTMTPDDLATVWGMIEDHIALEKKTQELADEALKAIGGAAGAVPVVGVSGETREGRDEVWQWLAGAPIGLLGSTARSAGRA